jgi:hypothetical protein
VVPLLPNFSYPFCFNSQADSFAYVDFATPEAKNAAIVMSESPLEGRRLLIKDGACVCICILYDSNPWTAPRRQF